MKIKHTLTVATFAFCASTYGAGYQIIEQGAANMGTAMAGSTANANNDTSCAFWNPSAAAFISLEEGETRVDNTVSVVMPTLVFEDAGSYSALGGPVKNNGVCSSNNVLPNFSMVHKFTDDILGTFSFTAPYGLESNYESDWVGRAYARRSYLFTMDFNPSIVYKVTDWFSISGGVSAQYAYCTLTSNLMGNEIDFTGENWSVGGNVGFTIQYAEDGRFGFNWRSAVDYTLEGHAHANDMTLAAITADMHMPNTFTMGIYQRLRGDFKEFAVMAEYAYNMWSCFESLEIKGYPVDPVEMDWKDTSRVAIGFHYYPKYFEDKMTIRIGSSFDESPVRSPTAKTARIPCCDRVWLSGGIGYDFDICTVDLSYTYIFLVGNDEINRKETGGLIKGNYWGHIHVVSVQVGFKF